MKPFEFTEEEFYKLKDATRAMQLMARMHEQVGPARDCAQEQYCAFPYLMSDSLSGPLDGVLERQRLAQEQRRELAAIEAEAAIADGRLPAENRNVAIKIGDANIDRLRAWLDRQDVVGLMPLPPINGKRNRQARKKGAVMAAHLPEAATSPTNQAGSSWA